MKAETITLAKAKENKLFYVVATVMAYRESDGRCLILKRDEREVAHPGKFAVPGGKLEWGDLDLAKPTRMNGDIYDFEGALDDLIQRETREEAGIEIELPLQYLSSLAFVRPDGIPVVLMKFCARYVSGDVVLEEGSFTDHAWVNAEEARGLPCVDGIPDEVGETIRIMSKEE